MENVEDQSEFVNKLDELLSNPRMMSRMGEKGRELAVSRYKWDRVASDILKVWELAEQNPLHVLSDQPQTQDVDPKVDLPPKEIPETVKEPLITTNRDERGSEGEKEKKQKQKPASLFDGDDNVPKAHKKVASLFEPLPTDDVVFSNGFSFKLSKRVNSSLSEEKITVNNRNSNDYLGEDQLIEKKPRSLFDD